MAKFIPRTAGSQFSANYGNYGTGNIELFFRLDGKGGVDPEKTSYDLYVDERLPNQFFYGVGAGIGANSHGMGGRISVIDGLPDQLSSEGGKNVYTDINGFYSVSGLEPGLYTVTVFMEDEDAQESTIQA